MSDKPKLNPPPRYDDVYFDGLAAIEANDQKHGYPAPALPDVAEGDYLLGRCMPLLQILDENEQAIKLLKDIRSYAGAGEQRDVAEGPPSDTPHVKADDDPAEELRAGEQRGDTPTHEYVGNSSGYCVVFSEGLSDICGLPYTDKVHSQEAQPLPARPKMRSGDMASHYAIDETNVYMNYLEAKLSRTPLEKALLEENRVLLAELSRLTSERDAANEATKSALASLAEMPRLIFESNQAVRAELASRIADLEEARLVDQEIIIAKCREIADLPTPPDSRKD